VPQGGKVMRNNVPTGGSNVSVSQGGNGNSVGHHLHRLIGAELKCENGHQAGGSNGYLWYRPEKHIDDGSNEGGVQTVLRGETSQSGIGDTLWYDGQTQGDAGDQIREGLLPIVAGDPAEEEDATHQPVGLLGFGVLAGHIHVDGVNLAIILIAILSRVLFLLLATS